MSIILDIRKEGLVYYDALDLSIQVAEAGFAFSTEAIELCQDLSDPDADPNETQHFITEMRCTARKAQDDANAAIEKFQAVQRGLFEVFLLRNLFTLYTA